MLGALEQRRGQPVPLAGWLGIPSTGRVCAETAAGTMGGKDAGVGMNCSGLRATWLGAGKIGGSVKVISGSRGLRA